MSFPEGFVLKNISKQHKNAKKNFDCGVDEVNEWLAHNALQGQAKNTSKTILLLDKNNQIAAYYTLVINFVDFKLLPDEIAKKLSKQNQPVLTLAWLGVDSSFQGQGLGYKMAAKALADCYTASQIVGFIGVVIDCLSPAAKTLYLKWFDFEEFKGNPMKLFLKKSLLDKIVGL